MPVHFLPIPPIIMPQNCPLAKLSRRHSLQGYGVPLSRGNILPQVMKKSFTSWGLGYKSGLPSMVPVDAYLFWRHCPE